MVHPVVGYYVMGDNFMFRIWQLTGSGQGVYAFVQSAPGNYDDTVALATMILEGMSFDVPR